MGHLVFAVRRFVASNLNWFTETRYTVGETGKERAVNINAPVMNAWYPEGIKAGRKRLPIGCRYFSGESDRLWNRFIVEEKRTILNQGGGKNWRLGGEGVKGEFYGTIRTGDLMLTMFDREQKILSWMCVRGTVCDENERRVHQQIVELLGQPNAGQNMWLPSPEITLEIVRLAMTVAGKVDELLTFEEFLEQEGYEELIGHSESEDPESGRNGPGDPLQGIGGNGEDPTSVQAFDGCVRDRVVIDLVKEVLGPRGGPDEVLPQDQDPRDEYITGVLTPADAHEPSGDIEADVDEIIEEEFSEEDQDTGGVMIVPGGISPALDPKALPRSIGLSFTVEASTGHPQIEICATWARYYAHPQGWQRRPDSFLTGPVRTNRDQRWEAAPGVSLQMRAHSLGQGNWRISLFMVNVTPLRGEGRPETDEHIFQPQIRVSCCNGTRVVPVWLAGAGDGSETRNSMAAEDASLAILYRERMAMARGHLCGAMWRDIDPERLHDHLESPDEAPFFWTDTGAVPASEREKFSPADVRTEMVPCYPVEAPRMDWDTEYGGAPILSPELLAELWQPDQMRAGLQPLADGYNAWIEEQLSLIEDLSEEHRPVAEEHLQQCMEAAERIQQAVEILASDEDIRLAFCFANKAIAVQAGWRGQTLTWRPFQLAFILLNIPAISDPSHPDRRTCDLLWFPTGGGKTEAYLGLAAFTLALRRRRAVRGRGQWEDNTGAGVGVLSRYTLRLLTIQQFRRALGVITACELLRVQGIDAPGVPIGWRPAAYRGRDNLLWGGFRFSIGLWVGGGVTPNNLQSIGPIPLQDGGFTFYAGALDILKGARRGYNGPDPTLRRNCQSRTEVEGEPAQILSCPCCEALLAIPDEGLGARRHTIHLVFRATHVNRPPAVTSLQLPGRNLTIVAADITRHPVTGYFTLSLTFTVPGGEKLTASEVDEWWYDTIGPALGRQVELASARPARPGYFILTFTNNQGNSTQSDFDIFCPNPACELNQHAWAEQVPVRRDASPATGGRAGTGVGETPGTNALPVTENLQWQVTPEPFSWAANHTRIARRIPIPALTVDDQVYHRCPSLVIATVDKFARLPYEPKAASLFGNVDHYHSRWGYYREGCPPSTGSNLPTAYRPHPPVPRLQVAVLPFLPPDLVLQDELHLIEGPLGSMFGLYETAIEVLCQRRLNRRTVVPKYIASTATVRQAEPQVQALFNRRLAQFPPPALSVSDRFFACDEEIHPLDCYRPGRLYVAVCAPGKGAPTPRVRIWSALLQSAYEQWLANPSPEADHFYTLVGYFNAIRELAGTVSLYRQDIPERMQFRAGAGARPLETDHPLELSGRKSSLDLPVLLDSLKIRAPAAEDVVFATSMFGTGVDVDRLGLMVVNGQPKTTASYIQATGRVGRQGGGLVVTFFQASRPRDLDHYEFFTGYHRALYRYVEPVTVAPFSPRARERALGPLAVALLRQAGSLNNRAVDAGWRVQQRLVSGFHAEAHRMGAHRHDPEVAAIPELFETRSRQQPDGRQPPAGVTAQESHSELDRWAALARHHPDADGFVYCEPALLRSPVRHVVLGDAHHRSLGLGEAYENSPQSLREVEETTGFKS